MKHIIETVGDGSIAGELGIKAGDCLVAINGKPVADILDFEFVCSEGTLEVEFETQSGESITAQIEKEPEEELGLGFSGLMDRKRACANRCVFCFIDQLPKGVRKTLKFKDDDWRLSFLMGNYVTLTNADDKELDRIIEQRISPLYISVHSMDPAIRRHLLRNKNAGMLSGQLEKLCKNGIGFHAQVVVCPGINDGRDLVNTLTKLYSMKPSARSCAIVPVGLTAHREGLENITPFDGQSAARLIDTVEALAEKFHDEAGDYFAYIADEFYLMAGRAIPPYERYGGFEQLEDGVGMIRLFTEEFENAFSKKKSMEPKAHKKATVATGEASYGFMSGLCEKAAEKLGMEIEAVPVKNEFFGGGVNVTGLLTGSDIIKGLRGRDLGGAVLISSSTLKQNEGLFLDDMRPQQIEETLKTPVIFVECDGAAFLDALINLSEGQNA